MATTEYTALQNCAITICVSVTLVTYNLIQLRCYCMLKNRIRAISPNPVQLKRKRAHLQATIAEPKTIRHEK